MANQDPRKSRRLSTSGSVRGSASPSGSTNRQSAGGAAGMSGTTRPAGGSASSSQRAQPQRKRRGRPARRKIGLWGWIWRTVFVLGCLGVMAGCALAVALSMYIVDVTQEDSKLLDLDNLKLSQTTILYAQNRTTGEWEEYATLSSDNHRIWVDLNEIPDNLKWAFICTEDKNFYTEPGFNLKRTVGATLNMLTGNKIYGSTQGASTIEQQLIKNLTGDDEQDALRKVREIFRAYGLFHRYSKDTVLEAYLNTISLTGTIAGVQAGAQEYFGKDVADCSLAECASIATITKNPTRYNPYTNPEEHLTRRNDILYFMYQQGKVEEGEYREASNSPLILVESTSLDKSVTHSSNNSYFTDAVFKALVKDIAAEEQCSEAAAQNIIYTSGLRIYTTVDPELQRTAEELMLNTDDKWIPAYWTEEEVSGLGDDDIPVYNDDGTLKTGTANDGSETYFRKVRTQVALVSMNYSGEVVAMVGGLGQKTVDLGLNRATVPRQTGSSMKPLAAYSLALEYGAINYSSLVPDAPFYKKEDKKVLNTDYCEKHGYSTTNIYDARALADPEAWRDWPTNYSGEYSPTGSATVAEALATSLNTSAVWSGSYVGTDVMWSFAHDTLEMNHLVPDDADYAPIVLGSQTQGVTPLELCAAYQIFYEGKYTTPHLYTEVEDYQGNLYLDKMSDVTTTQAISEETATIMNRLMRNVLVSGTAKGMSPKGEMDSVAKTGTATDFRDYTFVGLTPYYITSLWYGFDTPINMYALGAKNAKPIQYLWQEYMTEAQQNLEFKSFPYSNQVIQANYCVATGLLANGCSATAAGYYVEDNMPGICAGGH